MNQQRQNQRQKLNHHLIVGPTWFLAFLIVVGPGTVSKSCMISSSDSLSLKDTTLVINQLKYSLFHFSSAIFCGQFENASYLIS